MTDATNMTTAEGLAALEAELATLEGRVAGRSPGASRRRANGAI